MYNMPSKPDEIIEANLMLFKKKLIELRHAWTAVQDEVSLIDKQIKKIDEYLIIYDNTRSEQNLFLNSYEFQRPSKASLGWARALTESLLATTENLVRKIKMAHRGIVECEHYSPK